MPAAESLAFLDETLTALERVAWDVRGVADRAVGLWGEAGRAARDAEGRAGRLTALGLTCARVVADFRLFGIYSAFLTDKKRAAVRDRLHAENARRFRDACLEHRGAFLKVGQMLSARLDLLPEVWVRSLAVLQDEVPAEPFAAIRAVVEAELGAPLEERFLAFDETPLGAASIGQVHHAITREGAEVAVKVQRPGIDALVELDLSILEGLLDAMRGALPPADWPTITAEARDAVLRELDYHHEAASLARVADAFAGRPGIVVPRPLPALSTGRVLTCSFVAGERLTAALERHAQAGDRAAVSSLLGRMLEAYLQQILVDGFYQADPHPGNFLVTPAGELALLDFGCTRELPEAARRGYVGLVHAFLAGDRAQVTARLEGLGFATRSGSPATLEHFAEALLGRLREAASGTLSWPTRDEIAAGAARLLDAAQADPVVRMPPDFVMIGRVFGTLGGLFQHYRPDLDWATIALPQLVRAAAK